MVTHILSSGLGITEPSKEPDRREPAPFDRHHGPNSCSL